MNPENTALLSSLLGPYSGSTLAERYDSLQQIASAPQEELAAIPAVGKSAAAKIKAAFGLAAGLLRDAPPEPPLLDHPEKVALYIQPLMTGLSHETMYVLTINTRRRLIKANKTADGTLDTLLIHPRSIFRVAIQQNAAAVILAHNHPSGDPTPSQADINLTRDLIRAGQLLKIEVLDHVILGAPSADRPRFWTSLRELGHFQP